MMWLANRERPVRLSILDRILSPEPMMTRTKSLELLRKSVARDLDRLLNTVRFAEDLPSPLTHTVVGYGLPYIGNFCLPKDEERLVQLLTTSIQYFEPRIARGFRIVLQRPLPSRIQTFRFFLEGELRVEPAPEPVIIPIELRRLTGQRTRSRERL
jgi:type VI secretion system lysozyme-like protein